jgi:signal peptidase II
MNESLTDRRQPLLGRHSPLLWLALAVLVIILDWYSKQWASDSLVLYRPQALTSWLNLTLAHNYGAAFSILSDAGGWQRWLFTILAGAVTLVLLFWLFALKQGEWRTGLSLGLIIGGAAGNLVDRVRLGYVVDFIDVYYKNHHWPAFNVADSAITCGIILMLIDAIIVSMRKPDKNREDTA